ncbi:MAG: adenosylcobinamide-phosphate synthase CbiB [Rhizobiaceae bacterium]|nr:adenosylcobinamide-phosphate synthase CbiB [Rhizobiaceae bacterium]
MSESALFILLTALVLDWVFGEPDILWSRFPHPVVLFGKAVSWADKQYNIEGDSKGVKIRKGSWAIFLLVLAALLVGLGLEKLVSIAWPFGWVLELFVVFVLLAQKSLRDHVSAVAIGLAANGLQGGRDAVGMIVGRDPSQLDGSGICRASIESLAENFSDGVVAPAFWYAVFGLPGILVYKMINTADSMIAYKNEKYLWFGRSAAQIDDLANWVPARISAVLVAIGSGTVYGINSMLNSLKCAFRDAGLHRSPNAGWPEAAMAGGTGIALGGPRDYAHERVSQPFLNASGTRDLGSHHIEISLDVFSRACFVLWGLCLLIALL